MKNKHFKIKFEEELSQTSKSNITTEDVYKPPGVSGS